MRISALTAAGAILIAALAPQPAQARQGSVIYWRMDGDRSQINPAFARGRFQTALDRFAASLRRHPTIARSQFAQLTRFDYRPLPSGFAGEVDAPAQRDRDNALAVMWGNVTTERGRFTAFTSIYIGGSGIRFNVFDNVRGQTPPAGDDARLEMYQLIIGYALLIRAWRIDPSLVAPMVLLLQPSLTSAHRGVYGASRCLTEIERGIADIVEKAGENGLPGRHLSTSVAPRSVTCYVGR